MEICPASIGSIRLWRVRSKKNLDSSIRSPTASSISAISQCATGRATYYSTNHDYDPVNQIALIRIYYDPVDGRGPSRIVKLTQRKYFPAELEGLVAHAGMRVAARYGDFFWAPLDGSAESQVLICERPLARRKLTRGR